MEISHLQKSPFWPILYSRAAARAAAAAANEDRLLTVWEHRPHRTDEPDIDPPAPPLCSFEILDEMGEGLLIFADGENKKITFFNQTASALF